MLQGHTRGQGPRDHVQPVVLRMLDSPGEAETKHSGPTVWPEGTSGDVSLHQSIGLN